MGVWVYSMEIESYCCVLVFTHPRSVVYICEHCTLCTYPGNNAGLLWVSSKYVYFIHSFILLADLHAVMNNYHEKCALVI